MRNNYYTANDTHNFGTTKGDNHSDASINIFEECLDPITCYRKTLSDKEFEIVNSISQKMILDLSNRANSILNSSTDHNEENKVLQQLTQLFSQLTTEENT